jgi:hypothetical protein
VRSGGEDLLQGLQLVALLVDQQFRITNDVNEQDMADLELNFIFNVGGHRVKLRKNDAN